MRYALIIPGLLWMLMISFANYFMIRNNLLQVQAGSWPTTTGQVLSATLQEKHDDGSTYYPVVVYRYQVGQKSLESQRLRFTLNFTNKAWAQQELAGRPVGSQVTVHYNPANPEQACLDPKLRPEDAMAFLFLLPFNLVGLGLIGAPLWWRTHGTAGYPLVKDGPIDHIAIQYRSPLAMGGLTALAISFLLAFVNAVLAKDGPSWATIYAEFLCIAVASVHVGVSTHRRNSSPEQGLLWDRRNRRLSIAGQEWIAWNQVEGFELEEIVRLDSDGDKTYQYWLRINPLEDRQLELKNPDCARQLVAWLNQQLELPSTSGGRKP